MNICPKYFSDKIKPGGYKDDDRFTIWISDATKPEFLDVIGDTKFDIIIDDGSHILQDQVKTFNLMKPLMNPGGIYVIEDVANVMIDEIEFEDLHDNMETIDLRHKKHRYDDAMFVFKF